MKIATVVGARPQFIKSATVSRVLKNTAGIEEIIIHTGQHYDENMSRIFFSELEIPEPKYNLEVGSGPHGWQTGLMLERTERIFLDEKPDCVLVYGDTNSTLAGALGAVKLHIPVAHVEAGLRSFNCEMPEEINRIATDHISDKLFAPTENALALLEKEGLKSKAYLTGDVMYDAFLHNMTIAEKKYNVGDLTKLTSFYLATIHRPQNTDDHQKLQSIFEALSELDLPVLLPLHPRTQKLAGEIKYSSSVHIINPVGPLQMTLLLKHCKKVLTDSGGLQKESYWMNKACVTMREETEWVETLHNNWNILAGSDKQKILAGIKNDEFGIQQNAYGNGQAAEKIVELIS